MMSLSMESARVYNNHLPSGETSIPYDPTTKGPASSGIIREVLAMGLYLTNLSDCDDLSMKQSPSPQGRHSSPLFPERSIRWLSDPVPKSWRKIPSVA